MVRPALPIRLAYADEGATRDAMVKEMMAAAVMRKEVVTKFLEIKTSQSRWSSANAQ
jgi:hypothetical protein